MGGNTIVLLHGYQIEKGRELETTLHIISVTNSQIKLEGQKGLLS
jgi:hypothetical protein